MNDHPASFTTEMVQAILEGRKNQTRRVIKPQPTEAGLEFRRSQVDANLENDFYAWVDPLLMDDELSEDGGPQNRLCPYGIRGHTLFVRESFTVEEKSDTHDISSKIESP